MGSKAGERAQHADRSDIRTFGYSQGRFWSMVTIGVGVFLSFAFALSDWHMLLAQAQTPGISSGSLIVQALCSALIILIMFLRVFVFKLPPLFLAAGTVALDTRRRRAERITTSRDGICYDDGRRHVTAAWNEVTGHFIQASPQSATLRGAALSTSLGKAGRWVIVVETERGCFQYSLFIEGAGQLCRTIGERAMPLQKRDPAAEAPPIISPETCPPFSNSAT